MAMRDYEELVRRLRDSADWADHFAVLMGRDGNAHAPIMREAADAIEELQKVANKLLAKYQEEATGVIWEYSGHIEKSLALLQEEVIALQSKIDGKPEPPKEDADA